jgi:hypothetical protein
MMAVLSLATLGNKSQTGLFLFVSQIAKDFKGSTVSVIAVGVLREKLPQCQRTFTSRQNLR